ncbi:hypothetical protein [Halorussus pelagicus]|uniref:hypothetical protein n=1 Tax=Halorussus pelagicus TaxID=2505977 RepID=UPI000FFB1D79|nr:hypothetical protein [Halorussus pelagicus]
MSAFIIRRSTFVAVGLGVLLVVGAVAGGVVAGAFDAGASDETLQPDADTADRAVGAVGLQNESDGNDTTVSPNQTFDAMRTVENRTNGTVVGARLTGEGNSELAQSTFVYELNVLAANGTRLVAEVYASNQTVIGVEASNESDGFFDDLLGSDDGVPDEARNASSLRSGIEAVRVALNETEAAPENSSVTKLALGTRDDSLVYTVTILEPGGESREIVVAATKGADGVVTTDP